MHTGRKGRIIIVESDDDASNDAKENESHGKIKILTYNKYLSLSYPRHLFPLLRVRAACHKKWRCQKESREEKQDEKISLKSPQ